MVAAVRVHKTGGPEVLTYEEIDVAAPGAGQLRVKQHACGVNFIDTYFRMGMYPSPVGTAVRRRQRRRGRSGRGRAGRHRLQGRRSRRLRHRAWLLCGGAPGSGRSRRENPRQYQLRAGRRHDAQGHDGAIPGAAHLEGREGQNVLMHAAAGGVGLILCQWANHLGANVIGTVGSKEKAAPRQGQWLPPHHPLPRGGFSREGEGDHRRQAVRRGL